jgi:hypothetical protein
MYFHCRIDQHCMERIYLLKQKRFSNCDSIFDDYVQLPTGWYRQHKIWNNNILIHVSISAPTVVSSFQTVVILLRGGFQL